MDSSVATHNQPHATRRPHATSKPATRPGQATDLAFDSKGNNKNTNNTNNRTVNTPGSTPLAIEFPPSCVVLHPEDANNKVLAAIGRSLLAVDNRAMTVKDLADMVVNYGLVCQNVSAASQAITTYIRTHLGRCDAQQDCPLLLRHTLSGTTHDDDLLPALHSTSGGAQSTAPPEERATNFRRGTQVWYLSKAAGAPCPFARAGIRICDYGENGRLGLLNDTKDKQRLKERQKRVDGCGSKRKRPTRSCVNHESDSEPPPEQRVKLTLRLKPLNTPQSSSPPNGTPDPSSAEPIIDFNHDDDACDHTEQDTSAPLSPRSEATWTLPPYPRRSIAIPTYTPTFDGPYPDLQPSFNTRLRRSPSMRSLASPPPESDESDDEDDYEDYYPPPPNPVSDQEEGLPVSDGLLTTTIDEFDIDGDLDSERFDSPGPQSPPLYSMPLPMSDPVKVAVKQEPTVVEGLLDHWDAEYGGHSFDGMYDTGVKAEPEMYGRYSVPVKREWSTPSTISEDDQSVKQEETEGMLPLPSSPDSGFPGVSDEELSILYSHFAASLTDVPALEYSYREREDSWQDDGPSSPAVEYPTAPTRVRTISSPPPLSSLTSAFMTPPPLSAASQESWAPFSPISPATPSLTSVFASMSMSSPTIPGPGVSPSALALPFSHSLQPAPRYDHQQVIMHTIEPCNPAITATQIEGICVYQTKLGDMGVLRRIDTDWVNMSAIVAHGNTPYPKMSSTVTVDQGPVSVIGTWVPLSTAQDYVRQHPCYQNELGVFLSDTLHERFPSRLQDFHRANSATRQPNEFGPKFGSTPQATALCIQSDVLQSNAEWTLPSIARAKKAEEEKPVAELPLSAEEEEMFHGLCASPEWEVEKPAVVSPTLVSAPALAVEESPSEDVDMRMSPLSDADVPTPEPQCDVDDAPEAESPVRAGMKRKSPEPDTPPRSPSLPLQPTHTNHPPPAKRDCGSLRRSKRVAELSRPRTRAAAARRASKASHS